MSEIEEIVSVEANKPSFIGNKPNENLKDASENTAKLQKNLDFKEDKKDWFAEQEKELQNKEFFLQALSKRVVRKPGCPFKSTDNNVFQKRFSCGGEKPGHH